MKTTTSKTLLAAILLSIPAFAFAEPAAPEGKKGERPGKLSKKEMLAQFDKDGDGKLSPQERVPMLKKRSKENPKFAKKLMKKFDADKNGELSDAELLEAAKKMGQKKGKGKGPKKTKTPTQNPEGGA